MPDTVLAVVSRSNLNCLLAAFHRAGYGRVIRVIDPERAPVLQQLERAGVNTVPVFRCPDESVVVYVHAPERTSDAAAIAVASGASHLELVHRQIGINDGPPVSIVQTAQTRRFRRIGRVAEITAHQFESGLAAD